MILTSLTILTTLMTIIDREDLLILIYKYSYDVSYHVSHFGVFGVRDRGVMDGSGYSGFSGHLGTVRDKSG